VPEPERRDLVRALEDVMDVLSDTADSARPHMAELVDESVRQLKVVVHRLDQAPAGKGAK
jgi:hypothetical protein